MKRVIFAALMMTTVGMTTGCHVFKKSACDDGCGKGCCGLFRKHCARRAAEEAYAPGPPVGQVTYPYYTNRGPRDFLVDNPRGIGP